MPLFLFPVPSGDKGYEAIPKPHFSSQSLCQVQCAGNKHLNAFGAVSEEGNYFYHEENNHFCP